MGVVLVFYVDKKVLVIVGFETEIIIRNDVYTKHRSTTVPMWLITNRKG